MASTPTTIEQLEELLVDACARADEVCHAADPPRKMRELLAPLHAFVTQQLEKNANTASLTPAKSQDGSVDTATANASNGTATGDDTIPTPSPAKTKTPAILVDAVSRIQSFVAPSSSASSTGPRTAATRSDASSNSNNSNADNNKSTAADAQRGATSINKPPTGLFSGAVNRFQAFVRGGNSGAGHSTHETTIILSPKRAPISSQSDAATRIQALVRGNTERVSFTKQQSFLLQGTKVLKKYVLKSDRFPNCHVLDTPDGAIAPNFRRLGDSMLYGSAQPSLEGIQMILKRVAADGFSQVVWINLREEPVLYVDGQSFTARRIAKLNENDIVPGITGHKVTVLETSMANSLREQLGKTQSHAFEYWHEHALHENELVKTTVDPVGGVATVPELFESDAVQQAHPTIKSVTYYRLPIARENAPEHADVERIMLLIRQATPIVADATRSTAFIFNCQMGKRRTTTALVLAQLIAQQRPPPSLHVETRQIELEEPVGHSDRDDDARERSSSTTSSNGGNADVTTSVNKLDGNFAVIRELQRQLAFGRQAKQWVDRAIDDGAAIFNIRSVINEFYEQSLAAAKPAKRTFYLHHALSFLERYFYLIVFGTYLLETNNSNSNNSNNKTTEPPAAASSEDATAAATSATADESASTLESFSTWLQQHPHLFRLLDDMGGVRYRSDKVLLDCVIKEDHFFGHARIPYTLSQNVPNFRRVGDEPIFGTAQCLEAGFHDVVGHLRTEFDRVIWVNLREEAVIYVSGKPFGMRHPDDLTENVEYPGIEADEITAIESQVAQEVATQIRQANGLFIYFYEPKLMTSEETMDHVNADTEIKTLTQIYDEVADATAFDVSYARIPVTDETAPEEKDLDDMIRLLAPVFITELELGGVDSANASKTNGKSVGKPTAVVCNCQMGRGRTTTALVCTYMLRLVLQDHAATVHGSTTDSVLQQIGVTRRDGGDEDAKARRQSTAVAGDFVVIRKLLATLDNGDACKQLVDFAVDACAHLQNLRECIAQCRDLATDRDVANAKRDHFMRRAVNYLERYFYLICFASYLLEERVHKFETMTFGQWMSTRYGSALYALLDNLCFEENVGADTHVASMRWRWRRKRKLVSRLE